LYLNDDSTPIDNLTVYPENVAQDILLMHSSGTTGLPKPIALTHRQLVFAVSHGAFDTEEEAQGVNISTLPLFHGFGLLAPGLSMSIGKTVCFPSPDRFANAQHIVELMGSSNATGMMTVPFLLEDIVSLPNGEGTTALAKLDFVATGGSALSASTGEALTMSGVKLLNLYGTTETGPLTKTFAPKDNYDWKYFRLRTDMHFEISELEPYNGERRFRLTVFPFGASKPFEIADQLIRNEEFPESDFAAVGRDDDVIVLATGEKVNPLLLETGLTQSGLVKSAIVFGADRFEIGVIVEPLQPISEESKKEELKNKIWPSIVQVNERMDSTSRIYSPSSIIVVPPGIVIPRTDKGSIARKEVYQLLEKEISQVYELADQSAIPAAPLDYNNLEKSLKELIQTRLNLQVKDDNWSVDTNLFNLGLDSLQGTILRRMLLSAASKTPREIFGRDFIYVNPSISAMADVLRDPSSATSSNDSPNKEIERFTQKYSSRKIIVNQAQLTPGAVVLLTGSSGSLGSHVLAELASSNEVAKVICLLRKGAGGSTTTGQDHKFNLESRGIKLLDGTWTKITMQECDQTKEDLGLPEQVYTEVAESVTHVLHAAWPMNFHMHLSSFTYQFDFLNNLLRLALSRNTVVPRQKTRFMFISSIATLANLGVASPGQIIPEASLHVSESACGIGYADAKLVCEKILEEAAQLHATKLEFSIVRCGQLAGSKITGAWNTNEQIPMLVKTSLSLGIMPELRGVLCIFPLTINVY
jgi:UDP-glucose 4-epimerase